MADSRVSGEKLRLRDTEEKISGAKYLSIPSGDDQAEENSEGKKEILIDTSLFGIRSLVVAIHYAGNGFIMSSLGPTTAAASSVVTTIQTFTIGASSGFLVSTASALSKALGQKKTELAGDIIKTGWLMSFVLGGFSSAIFLSTRYVFPLVLKQSTADAAANFFRTFSIAAIPDLFISTNGQIIYKAEKNSWIPLLSTIAYRGTALGLSYYFAKILDYGAKGVGLGAGIAGWGSLILFQPWFFRKAYKELNLYNVHIENFCTQLAVFLGDGWKFSLQRITEWANLAIITQIIGRWSNQGLLAEQSSVLMLTLCNLLSQGFSQASMMIAIEDCTKIQEYFKRFDETGNRLWLVQARKLIDKNYKNGYLSIVAGLTFNVIMAGSLCFSRSTIVHWYVPNESPDSTTSLAETLLWVNAISLIPDAIRIITGGTLRGWGDLLYPTLASLIIMSVIGIPIGFGIGSALSENILTLFITRIIALILSAVFNCFKIAMHTGEDETQYNNLLFSSDLILIFNLQKEIQNMNNDLQALNQNVLNFGFSIRSDEGSSGSLFTVIATAMGSGQTHTNIKVGAVKHIRNHPYLYEEFFVGRDRETFLRELEDGENRTSAFIGLAVARSCNVNLVVMNGCNEDLNIIFHKDATNTIYLAQDSTGNYHLLEGKPSNKIIKKIEKEKMINLHQDRMRNEERPFSGRLTSHFFKNNMSRKKVLKNGYEEFKEGDRFSLNQKRNSFS